MFFALQDAAAASRALAAIEEHNARAVKGAKAAAAEPLLPQALLRPGVATRRLQPAVAFLLATGGGEDSAEWLARHGLRALDDPKLLKALARRQAPEHELWACEERIARRRAEDRAATAAERAQAAARVNALIWDPDRAQAALLAAREGAAAALSAPAAEEGRDGGEDGTMEAKE